MASHLWAKMAENGWKQVFDNTYLNLLVHTKICSMGQHVVFKLFYGITQGAYYTHDSI